MLPLGAIDEENVIPAMWVFGPEEDYQCHCRVYYYTDNKNKHSGQGDPGCGQDYSLEGQELFGEPLLALSCSLLLLTVSPCLS